MKRRSRISRILAMVLTMSLILQQAGITTLADDGADGGTAAIAAEQMGSAASQENADTTSQENAVSAAAEEEASASAAEAQNETGAANTQEEIGAADTQNETGAANTQEETGAADTQDETSAVDVQEEAGAAAGTQEENDAAAEGGEGPEASDESAVGTETGSAAGTAGSNAGDAGASAASDEAAGAGEASGTSDENEAGAGNQAEADAELLSEEGTATAAGTETVTGIETAAGTGAETETESRAETETETETESEAETETETETETESETETETEEHPDTFIWKDDEKTVTVVLSDPEALPLGAEFVVKDLTEEEYAAYKALIIEQQFANDETYGETVEARTALAEILLANMVLYDMHFEYEGTEIEPDANTMSVTIKNKKAVDVSSEEVVESDGYVFVQEEDADSSIVAIHIEETGKEETVVDVTDEVKTNANGDVKTVELTVEGFSTIGYYPLTEYQQIPITDDTLINDWGGSYTLYFILNNYNIFTSGNALAQHTVGAVAVGGTSSFTYGIGAGNYGTHPVPSYFQGGFVSGGFNSYIGGNAIYFTGYDSNVYSWAYQSYDLRFNDGGTGTIDSSVTHNNGYFINFSAAMSAIEAEMSTYVNSSAVIKVDMTNTGAALETDHYTVSDSGEVTLQSGYSFKFSDLDSVSSINIVTDGSSDSQNVNIISEESGTVVLPKVHINGSDPTGSESDVGCGLVFMLPNASTVDIGSKSNGTFLGHVVAPNAAVVSDVSGNTNGSFICASFNVPSMENHMWHYNGSLIQSDSHGFTAAKTLDGAAPTDADDEFSFTLSELNTSGEWEVKQTKKSTYGTGLVTFDTISYSAVGTHWYLISEVTGDTSKYTFDDTLYLVKVVVTSTTTGTSSTTTTYTAAASYYKAASGTSASDLILASTNSIDTSKLSELTLSSADDETSTIFTFGNTTITGSLWITKNVTVNGETTTSTDADGTYTFYVKDSSGTTVETVEITIVNGVSNTVEVTDLPVGTYTVEEDITRNKTGMTLTGGNDISVTVTENGTAAASTASFTNDLEKVGSLKITKNVTVNGEATTGTAADGTYVFEIHSAAGELKDTVTITIENGQSNTVQVDNLAEGKYYILEVLSYNPYGMELVGDNSIVVEVKAENTGDAIPAASFTNNLTQVGSLKITKNVTVNGDPAADYDDPTAADGTYTFYVVQESTGITKADRTITIKNGESTTVQVDNLEPGWYLVSEYLAGNPEGMTLVTDQQVRIYVYGDNTNDEGETVINVAEFTNNKTEVGSLAITKFVTVNGDPAAEYTDPTVADGTYTFYVVDENNNVAARTTAVIFNGVSSTVQIDNLEPGIYYVYEELSSHPTGMALTSRNGQEVTVTANNTADVPTVEFVNDLEQVGSLKITKNVTINGEDPSEAEDPTAADGTYTFYVVDESNNEVARRNITITNGVSNTAQIDNLIPGVYYVYEYLTGHTDGAALVTPNGVKVTVEANNTASIPTVSFTNDIEAVGSLKITKNVTIYGEDPADAEDPTAADGTYTFLVKDENGDEAARRHITIVNGESKTEEIDNLIPGTYYVYEVTSSLPDYIGLVSEDGVKVTVTADNSADIPTAEFTNNYADTYTASGSLALKAMKSMAREDSELGSFAFVLTEVSVAENGTGTAAITETGTVLQTVTNNTATGEISFEALEYTQEDVGRTYTYTVSENAQTGTGYLFDETVYTVTVDIADNGDGTLEITATVDDGSGNAADYTDTAMTFINDVTSVRISKVDIVTEEELPGAVIQIIKADEETGKETVVEEWTSAAEAHEVTGLVPGETYILRETVAPDGYDITTDTTFVLNEDGSIDTAKTTTATSTEGVLLVEDSMTKSADASITVTKELLYVGESDPVAINAVDQTFYVALYYDADCAQRASEVQAIHYQNASSGTATFTNLEVGRTYYIGECKEDGTVQAAGFVDANGNICAANFEYEGNVVVVEEADGSETIYFANEFYTIPLGYSWEGELTITKKLLGADGNALESDSTFYAGIFTDADFTTLATTDDGVSANVIAISLDGGSEASTVVKVGAAVGTAITLYVTETDENGVPVVSGSDDFLYEVTVTGPEVVLTESSFNAEVTITNQEIEEEEESESEIETETESETETETEKETETESETEANAVQTGDETPLLPYAMAMLLAALVLLAGLIERKRRISR